MEFEFVQRNNDHGAYVPTVQERLNAESNKGSVDAAQAYALPSRPTSPHFPSSSEVEQTLSMMEMEAEKQNVELLQLHAGLDEERVRRLLQLLQD